MVPPGTIYGTIVAVLLLVALGASIPVLKGIVRDGLERRRKRKAGELERYAEDEAYDRGSAVASVDDGTTALTCRECGAENRSGFRYCRRCTQSL
jgi:hypothetical protein